MEQQQTQPEQPKAKTGVSWGKILIGAAVAAAAVAVVAYCPAASHAVDSFLFNAAETVGSWVSGAASVAKDWVFTEAHSLASLMASNPGTSVGAAAAVGATAAAIADSFTAREDMRRMQERMQAAIDPQAVTR